MRAPKVTASNALILLTPAASEEKCRSFTGNANDFLSGFLSTNCISRRDGKLVKAPRLKYRPFTVSRARNSLVDNQLSMSFDAKNLFKPHFQDVQQKDIYEKHYHITHERPEARICNVMRSQPTYALFGLASRGGTFSIIRLFGVVFPLYPVFLFSLLSHVSSRDLSTSPCLSLLYSISFVMVLPVLNLNVCTNYLYASF